MTPAETIITPLTAESYPAWQEYVARHPEAIVTHDVSWREVIGKTLGHRPQYLVARDGDNIVGVLPMFLTRTWWGKKYLVSIPWLDYGGVLADSTQIAENLLAAAVKIGEHERVEFIELRSRTPMFKNLPERTDKVTFLLDLSPGEENLWKNFDAKLRNQIRKADKSGVETELGGEELLADFYHIFATNMRDLGTPVWPRTLFASVLKLFADARIALVRHEGKPIGGALVLAFKDRLYVPSASAYRRMRKLCPNHSMYWTVIRYGCEHGFRYFDFGRSTWNAATFNFKKQWVPEPTQLVWQYVLLKTTEAPRLTPDNPKYRLMIRAWRKLPLPIANFIGPHVIRNFP